MKPFSQACINNRDAILDHLERLIPVTNPKQAIPILELGSGTGQHAVYFSHYLSHVEWQTSDLADNHQGIQCWLDDAQQTNCLPPIDLDITQAQWRIVKKYHAVFLANLSHTCSWEAVVLLFEHVSQALKNDSLLIIYGPFNYAGAFTSESNERFDQFLKASNPKQGIREYEKVVKLASESNLVLEEDQPMPANNRLLVFRYAPIP